eukprot:TRINITY_DN6039_c0_g3_i2.p1 TRINITY_DN6039_c0_g3~~TRINITY_DN6039_c0_g3_i2.p1  ORF type:complete len:194 (-),score=75.44 TRINITY_DN6039_c0_g3_i2:47-628(-)
MECASGNFMNLLEEELSCAVCLEIVREPRALNCLHSFCTTCINDCLRKGQRMMQCPLCMQQSLLKNPDAGAASFPVNVALKGVADRVRLSIEENRLAASLSKPKRKIRSTSSSSSSSSSSSHRPRSSSSSSVPIPRSPVASPSPFFSPPLHSSSLPLASRLDLSGEEGPEQLHLDDNDHEIEEEEDEEEKGGC